MQSEISVPNTVAVVDEDEQPPHQAPRSRRALLAGALGGVAGWFAVAAARVAPDAHAAAGDPLILGTTNYAGSSATRLNATSSGGAFWMTQNGSGSGVRGDSSNGHGGIFTTNHQDRTGITGRNFGLSAGTGAAVSAIAIATDGVVGTSNDGSGVRGESINNHGVHGESTLSSGVYGLALGSNQAGVVGAAADGNGVEGTGTNIGVLGQSVGGHGVVGASTNNAGVSGTGQTGVVGTGTVAGVSGSSTGFYGVDGFSDTGTGVRGLTNTGVAVAAVGPATFTRYLQIGEMTAPANAPSNQARLFVRDNGASKSQLCVIFPTGAVIVLATEA